MEEMGIESFMTYRASVEEVLERHGLRLASIRERLKSLLVRDQEVLVDEIDIWYVQEGGTVSHEPSILVLLGNDGGAFLPDEDEKDQAKIRALNDDLKVLGLSVPEKLRLVVDFTSSPLLGIIQEENKGLQKLVMIPLQKKDGRLLKHPRLGGMEIKTIRVHA